MKDKTMAIMLDQELVDEALLQGSLESRSAAEQIEHWVRIGRFISSQLSPNNLLELIAGISDIKLERRPSKAIDMQQVLGEIREARNDGSLSKAVTKGSIAYGISQSHPGLLEEVSSDGSIRLGTFKNGKFTPTDVPTKRSV